MRQLSQQLEERSALLDASRAHVTELEARARDQEETMARQKRMLKEVKDEYHEQLQAVESKYEAQRAVNRVAEERMLELWQRLEAAAAAARARRPQPSQQQQQGSPDCSSCHEAIAAATHGSPPLSASLASSEGSMRAFLAAAAAPVAPTPAELRNLQAIVDRSSGETTPDGTLPSPSTLSHSHSDSC